MASDKVYKDPTWEFIKPIDAAAAIDANKLGYLTQKEALDGFKSTFDDYLKRVEKSYENQAMSALNAADIFALRDGQQRQALLEQVNNAAAPIGGFSADAQERLNKAFDTRLDTLITRDNADRANLENWEKKQVTDIADQLYSVSTALDNERAKGDKADPLVLASLNEQQQAILSTVVGNKYLNPLMARIENQVDKNTLGKLTTQFDTLNKTSDIDNLQGKRAYTALQPIKDALVALHEQKEKGEIDEKTFKEREATLIAQGKAIETLISSNPYAKGAAYQQSLDALAKGREEDRADRKLTAQIGLWAKQGDAVVKNANTNEYKAQNDVASTAAGNLANEAKDNITTGANNISITMSRHNKEAYNEYAIKQLYDKSGVMDVNKAIDFYFKRVNQVLSDANNSTGALYKGQNYTDWSASSEGIDTIKEFERRGGSQGLSIAQRFIRENKLNMTEREKILFMKGLVDGSFEKHYTANREGWYDRGQQYLNETGISEMGKLWIKDTRKVGKQEVLTQGAAELRELVMLLDGETQGRVSKGLRTEKTKENARKTGADFYYLIYGEADTKVFEPKTPPKAENKSESKKPAPNKAQTVTNAAAKTTGVNAKAEALKDADFGSVGGWLKRLFN